MEALAHRYHDRRVPFAAHSVIRAIGEGLLAISPTSTGRNGIICAGPGRNGAPNTISSRAMIERREMPRGDNRGGVLEKSSVNRHRLSPTGKRNDMNTIHPAVIREIERRRREHEADKRLPLYVPVPEREPKKSENREVEYVIEF